MAEGRVAMVVNKQELARILGVSMPTLGEWMVRHGAAFPVISSGGRGRDWTFDPNQVIAFLAKVRNEAERAEAERNAALQQYLLPMGHNGGPTMDEALQLAPRIKPQDKLALMKVRRMQREEAYHAGRLVDARATQEALGEMFTVWSRLVDEELARVAADRNLPADAVEDLAVGLRRAKQDLVRFLKVRSQKQIEMFENAAAE